MVNEDTIHLLKECDAGVKMGISSIDDVLDSVHAPELMKLLVESREHHEKLQNDIQRFLDKAGSEGKDPNPMAKSMSWIKTNVKISMDDSDSTIADLMTDGADMGVKSLRRYQNQYKDAEHSAKDICNRLIDIEEQLRDQVKRFL